MRDSPARQKEISAAIPRDESGHRGMIVFAETHDHIVERGDTLAFEIDDRPTQYLRQVQHWLILALTRIIAEEYRINGNNHREKKGIYEQLLRRTICRFAEVIPQQHAHRNRTA